MLLIIGGVGAGAREYADSLGLGESDLAEGVWDAVYDNPAEAMALLEPLCLKAAVICEEVGSGVVPIDRREREAREAMGRLTAELAARAQSVVRVVAGIPVTLK
ncbi:MAG: bifunctional adenosylcobinamide kinase/adenosylcobinamide-phosphate guanylyltransferase [Oscillospiraceae bacterium]|jgi:adenosyl cobinamide kinase/adenosyl cobinamide phosphate guanylyltransferase|nr:bifunctional adenosylcobinamide kinase/adenosylcobinamide-phosphate guanylyltransferase [Oscillospiraceae bacterium]